MNPNADPSPPPPSAPLGYASPPLPPPPEHLRPRTIVYHVGFIFLVSVVTGFVGGFVNGAAGFPVNPIAIAAVANVVSLIVGFAVAGCWAPTGNRWPHLAWVALGTWLTGLLNVVLFDFPPLAWIAGAAVVFALMPVGGALSRLIKP